MTERSHRRLIQRIFSTDGRENQGKTFRGRFKPFKGLLNMVYSTITMPGGMWTKMGSEAGWQDKAEEYYRDGLMVVDIEALLGVSRKSISAYLKGLPDYEKIREGRRKETARRRRQDKTKRQREYRLRDSSIYTVSQETMRREHELAVMELSREKYH